MSEKKDHEVEVMSHVIANLSKGLVLFYFS